jgi:hypothetical protein
MNIQITETYRIYLEGGLQLLLTRSEHRDDTLDIKVEWANGETMESFSEWNVHKSDLEGISELFSTMAKRVNA